MTTEQELMQDKYDMIIDRFEEEYLNSKIKDINEILEKILQEFNLAIDSKFVYYLLKRILKSWVDMEVDYYDVITSWILGTYCFDSWISYPYIFINAVKRSGKTRLLKLISYLSKDGVYTMSLTESVLFRLPATRKCGLFIDEIENIVSKEKTALRELLNVAYKRGGSVFRMRKNPFSEKYVPEEFELFIPLAMANISGLEDILNDRCLTMVLERSENNGIINKLEFFDRDPSIKLFRMLMFDNRLVSLVSSDTTKQYTMYYHHINYTIYNSIDTNDTSDIQKMKNKGVVGRDLELWLPLFVIKKIYTENVDDLIDIASKFAKERQVTDMMEDRDTSMILFLAKFMQGRDEKEWVSYSDIIREYNEQEGIDNKSKFAMNSHILARIFKRLKIVKDKKRSANSRQVTFYCSKINEKLDKLGIKLDDKIEEKQETLVDQDGSYIEDSDSKQNEI